MTKNPRTVLITGATAGFGKAIAERFLAQGDRVIGTGRRMARLQELAGQYGDRFLPVSFDMQDRSALLAAIDDLPAEWQAIDVLINNAGLALGLGKAFDASLDDWDTMIATNCAALAAMTRAVLPRMIAANSGHIVNISSISGSWPYPGGNVYGATKAFVTQFSQNLRADLLGKNIRVTNIEPGLAETEFSLVRFKGDASAAKAPYQAIEALTAGDIAETVLWSCNLPQHVNINRIEVMPTMQALAGLAVHRD